MRTKISLVLLSILLVSCSTASQIPTIATVNLATLAATPTVTAAVPTLTLTTTPIPAPTLVDQNSFMDFIAFTEASTCRFPCWAGIVPGKTNWNEAIFALRPIESIAKIKTYLDIQGLFGKENVITWSLYGDEFIVNGDVGAIIANQNVVNLISMNIEGSSMPSANVPSHSLPLPRRFNMQSVLQEYGIPSSIFIYTYVDDRATDHLSFKVLLVYAENQFYIEYHRFAKLIDSDIVACESEYYLELLVEDSVDKLVSADAIANTPETKKLRIEDWRPVEQALNISPEKFHETYSASSPECMISPRNLWLP